MTRDLTHLFIVTGPGGWLKARWRRKGVDDENAIYVRFRPPVGRSTWSIMGLHASKDSSPRWLSSELVRDVPLLRIQQAVIASEVFRSGLLEGINEPVLADDLDQAFKKTYKDAPRTVLERPARNKLDDSFYRQVAMAYRQAVEAGLPPGETMARDSDVPRGTINRWIAEARARHFLPPAEPGKVSA